MINSENASSEHLGSRVAGLVSSDIANSSVIIVGAGSVGSFVCEHLVRTGLTMVAVIDADCVTPSNLSRSSYEVEDIGSSKVEACSRIAEKINPNVKLQKFENKLEEIDRSELQKLFEQSSIVIACTDSPSVQSLINWMAWATKTTAVYIGLYKGARGGEVIFSIPEITNCMDCSVGGQRKQQMSNSELSNTLDYGIGRIEGEIALGCNIHFVSTAAIRLIIDLLAITDSDSLLGELAISALNKRMNMILFGIEHNYWIFPEILKNSPGQHAFNSVWVLTESNPDCALCGNGDSPWNPFESDNQPRSLDLSELRTSEDQDEN